MSKPTDKSEVLAVFVSPTMPFNAIWARRTNLGGDHVNWPPDLKI